MLGTIIRNQILENIYGIKFIIIFSVCMVLMLGTAISGVGRYQDHQEDKDHIEFTNEKSLAGASSWRDVGREGLKVVKPANKLGILSSGLEDAVGRTATVRIDDYPYMEDSIYSTAPIFAIFGELDMTFIIRTVISLFVILFTFDLISGEKERGTLKQCLANPVPRNTFMLGKSIGSFISLLIPIVLPLLLSMLIILVTGGISFNAAEWSAISIIFLGYLFYIMAFFSLGIFVSTLVRSSSISFLVLLFVWVIVVLIVPKGAMMIAGQIHPIESINDVRSNLFNLRENYMQETWTQTVNELQARGLNMETNPREFWRNMRSVRGEVWEKLEPEYEGQKKNINEGFKRDQAYLTDLAVNISRISPASAVTYISMNMAGTGYAEQENFLRQLTLYREQFAKEVEEQQAREREEGRGHFALTSSEERGELAINELPDYDYEPYSTGERLIMVLPDLASLAIISIFFYLLAFINFLRYDVR